MSEWTLQLPFRTPPLGLNQRLHWAEKNRRAQSVKNAAHVLAVAGQLPRGLSRVHVVLHWQPSVTRRRDSDNPSPTLKHAIDGLIRYGLTEDDDAEHVSSGCVIEPVAASPRLWLVVTDLSDAA